MRYFNYLADKPNAITPDTNGAAADVPVCLSVHFPFTSVVNYINKYFKFIYKLFTKIGSNSHLKS